MTTVILASEMCQHSNGQARVEIDAATYRQAMKALNSIFPALTDEVLDQYSIALDGVIIHKPLMEKLENDSELVFIPKIASG